MEQQKLIIYAIVALVVFYLIYMYLYPPMKVVGTKEKFKEKRKETQYDMVLYTDKWELIIYVDKMELVDKKNNKSKSLITDQFITANIFSPGIIYQNLDKTKNHIEANEQFIGYMDVINKKIKYMSFLKDKREKIADNHKYKFHTDDEGLLIIYDDKEIVNKFDFKKGKWLRKSNKFNL